MFWASLYIYCAGQDAQQEKQRCQLAAVKQEGHGGGPEQPRVSALRQFLVGPVLHQVQLTWLPGSFQLLRCSCAIIIIILTIIIMMFLMLIITQIITLILMLLLELTFIHERGVT